MSELTTASIQRVDKDGMLDRVLSLGRHLEQAWQEAQRVAVAVDAERVKHIVIAGMGGSAISGDLVRALAATTSKVPVMVNRHYVLPEFVGPETLVVASSYSGNTEETLAGFDDAISRRAQVVAITSGGRLEQRAREHGCTVYPISVSSPPRAAIAFLTAPLLHLLGRLGHLAVSEDEVAATGRRLTSLSERYGPENLSQENLCANLACQLYGKLPIIYAAVTPFEGIAWRWKGQFSENSKVLAFANVFPELNHNEIVGWGLDKSLQKKTQVIYLRDRGEHPRVRLRFEITREILESVTASPLEIWSEGDSLLERLFSLVFIGDLTSVYLAVLNNVDPTPVSQIDFLKNRLSKV